MSVTSEGTSEGTESPPSLDLDALDAALSPVRRALHHARRIPAGEVRYLGVIGARWLRRACAVSTPAAVSELLDEMVAALDGFDEAEEGERAERLAVLHANLTRVDALLGLPLPVALPSPSGPTKGTSSTRAERDAGERSSSVRRDRSRRRKSRKRKPEPLPAQEEAPAPVATIRWLDEAAGMRPLTALDAPGEILEALDEAGITTVGALLTMRPTGEEVIQPVHGAGRVATPGRAAVGGRVKARRTVLAADGTATTELVLQGAGPTRVRWTRGAPAWLLERLTPGSRAVLVGDVEIPEAEEGGRKPIAVLKDPELACDDGKHAARLATYDVEGIPDHAIRALVLQALAAMVGVMDPVPAHLVADRGLLGLEEALSRAHTRGSRGADGGRRLAYDEALLVHLGLLWERFQGSRERGVPHTVLHGLAARALQLVGAELNDEQQAAFEEVKRDLRASSPMRRVLTGEVGAGKGLVALLTMALVCENKNQVMVIAPDRATAEQRYAFTEPLLRDLGLVARLLEDKPGNAYRDALRRGEVHVVFGTEALLEADLQFRRLGLVVAGERDTFGSVPLKVARLRAPQPDLLVITSTPVAWPVLLQAYPAFDITMQEQPPGKQVRCVVHPADDRQLAWDKAREAVDRHEQVAVVFPMHRGGDVLDVREALRVVATLEERVFPGARVKLFHGAMSREERYRTYQDFRDHRLDVLVATTHFEAGPAVPGVSTVIVEQADRMTQSRLHRVRGHVSVGTGDPLLLLVTGENPDEPGLDRVRAFAAQPDGFEVSVQELEDRGLEAMLAVEVGELPEFSWIDPKHDVRVLATARRDARGLLAADPGLRRGPSVELARYLKARWDDLFDEPCPVAVGGTGGGRRRRRRRKR